MSIYVYYICISIIVYIAWVLNDKYNDKMLQNVNFFLTLGGR